MSISAQELNQALGEYIQTFPNESRLNAYLASNPSSQSHAEIKSELSAVVKTTEEFLWAQPSGVSWSGAFEDQLFTHIRSRHSWLERQAFSTLLGFSKWLCWHEGLNA
ncbi:hypothetical protein [Pseudomonas aeruginosa]|nr:hypothetical protein [Pseudomonas aeruginosa]EKV4132419.1 hypothetical protein [Pseudomonas aeruginosa]EKW1536504.1 hypothetical protein [Pseudomonas aeruginosa]EKW1536706.1 hypothetical protein [Pseudomonas aeruginosa]ELQ7979146.1 hypothetical protein [Pseudomonas aeruginosa]